MASESNRVWLYPRVRARRRVGGTGKNIDIVITSVLQTTAGKMFFGKFETDLEKSRNAG